MNKRAEHAYRIRLATLAKSAKALDESDGAGFVRELNSVMSQMNPLVNSLQDAAKTGRIPRGMERDYTYQKAVRYGDADKALADATGKRVSHMIIVAAAELARWIIRFKSIPKGQAKALERAAKPFLSARRAPRKIATWVVKNEKNIDFLLKAYERWDDKGEDSPDKYPVGPFTVHNTLQLEGDDLAKTNKVIAAATKFVKGSGIPGVGKATYGDVFVVGKLQGHNTLAWYNFRDDNIYLRPLLKADMDATHSLAHEIGHRYWRKQVPRDVQAKWRSYHMGKGYETVDVKDQIKEVMDTIRVGEPMPVPIKGYTRGGPPIIVEIVSMGGGRNAKIVYEIQRGSSKGKQGMISASTVYNFLHKQEARQMRFPSDYASTSPEEHFAESFGFYALKKLSGTHKENFERLIVNR